jgi:biotin-dependent carboxylase-like uncharacterized protein
MSPEVCEIEATGIRMCVQDQGRTGWARYGVPVSGAMDHHAASWANRLLNNALSAPVLELLGSGARLRFLQDIWIAVTGAHTATPAWRTAQMGRGDTLRISELRSGLWTYVAIEGGFDSPNILGSASVYERGGIGRACQCADMLRSASGTKFTAPPAVSSRIAPWTEQRDYLHPPTPRVWPAPQWDLFSGPEREKFFGQEWTVTPQSDRVGYRLAGTALHQQVGELLSEPILVGTIQVPPNGQPIVTMRDGPTVGGYPKLGVLEPADVSWLAQMRPGERVRFQPAREI